MARLAGADGSLSSITGRMQVWERAGMAIRDFPFTGVGLGMFRFVQPRLYPIYTVPPQTDVGHAHNQLLQVGVDVGVPGLTAYLVLWLGAAALGLGLLWQGGSPYAGVMLGLMAGWAGYLLWALVEAHALGSKAGWLWWWALALIVGTTMRARRERVG
jgi:O-antigen ligase